MASLSALMGSCSSETFNDERNQARPVRKSQRAAAALMATREEKLNAVLSQFDQIVADRERQTRPDICASGVPIDVDALDAVRQRHELSEHGPDQLPGLSVLFAVCGRLK